MAVRNSLLEGFSGNVRRCWKILPRFSGSANSSGASGDSLHGAASFMNKRLFLLHEKRVLENRKVEVKLAPPFVPPPEALYDELLHDLGIFPARRMAGSAGKSAPPSGTLLDFLLRDRHSLLEFICLLQGKKEYAPPLWHPSFLGPSPDPKVTEPKNSDGVYHFPGKTRETGIHHRSGRRV